MSISDRIIERLAGNYIARRIAEATAESDYGWRPLTARQAELPQSTIRQMQDDSIEAWRTNPMAFRIVEITIDYVIGQAFSFQAKPQAVHTFLTKWWEHPLNNMDHRMRALLRELALTGDLFVTYHTNPADGMTYIRTVPSTDVSEIETAPNDIDQELNYTVAAPTSQTPVTISADSMSHFTINKLTGSTRGQGDLWPVLPWLRRYKDWLTDRVIANKFKTAFLWDVTLTGADPTTITRKKNELAGPPTAGSVLVHNDAEKWAAVQPNINADSCEPDGRAIRTMISTGTGIPLHWLGEGTEYNRAVGELMDEPAKRRLEHRQQITKHILTTIINEVLSRARAAGILHATRGFALTLTFPDLTTNDLLAQAQSLQAASNAIATIQTNQLFTDPRYRAWLMHFAQMLPTSGDDTNIADPDTEGTGTLMQPFTPPTPPPPPPAAPAAPPAPEANK